MPQICKARIVNFYYNNGHRFIPNLIFSFEGADGTAMDTLISLTNGGGKSVIVQMLLQPILPGTKLNQRRLESYFTRSTDHSFVLLEWKLDDSTQRLLTGIALSGRGEEDENQQGRQVRYYTFCATYGFRGDREDIVNLPLSTQKGREFQSAPYEFVKEQVKKRNSCLRYFRKDQQPEYRKVLESYGISVDEWKNVVAEINQEEGGLSKYFDAYRNSSRLIDGVLLPCVEKKLNAGAVEGEDSSLNRLLLDFAQDYHNVEDKVRQRNLARELETELKQCCDEVEPLYHKADECEATAGTMRGFARSLERLEEEQRTRREQCDQTLKDCEEQEQRIRLERCSDAYHRSAEEQERAAAALEEARHRLVSSEADAEAKRFRVTQLECARLQGQIRTQEGSLLALQEQMRVLEGDTDRAETLNRLRYTVWSLAAQRLAQTQEQLTALERNKAQSDAELEALQQRENTEQKRVKSANAEQNRRQGVVENQRDSLEQGAEELGLVLDYRLDGSLEEAPIHQGAEHAGQALTHCVSRQSQCRTSLKQCRERLEELREQQTERTVQLHILRNEMDQTEKQLRDYRQQEEALRTVFRRQELAFSQRFSDRPRVELRQKLEEARLRLQHNAREQELVRRQMAAAEQGAVHVSQDALHCLTSRGITPQTCEQHLRNWPLEQVTQLLERYPICAYGIVLSEKERQMVLSEQGGEWLRAAVPLFTHDDLTAMLSGTYQGTVNALACYSEEYFRAPEEYRERLEERAANLSQTEERLRSGAEQMERDLRTVEAFDCDENHEPRLKAQLDHLEKEIHHAEADLAHLTDEQERTRSLEAEQDELLKRLLQEENTLNERIRQLKSLAMLTAAYAQQLDALLSATAEAGKCARSLKKTQEELKQCRERLEQLKTELRNCTTRRDEYQDLCEHTAGAAPAEAAEGDLETLRVQLERMEREQNEDVRRIREETERISDLLKDFRAQLRRKKLAPSDYEGISYTEQAADEAEENSRLAEQQLRENQELYRDLERDWIRKKTETEMLRKNIQGEPLPPEEIHYQFEQREGQIQEQRDRVRRAQSELRKAERQISQIQESCGEYDSRFAAVTVREVMLEQNFVAQWKALRKSYEQAERERKELHRGLRQHMEKNQQRFGADAQYQRLFRDAVELLDGGKGVHSGYYYTLYDQLHRNVDATQRLIESLNTQIGLLDERRREMDHQFYREGQRIYDNLKKLAESTRVRVEGKKAAIPMLKINLPAEVDSQLAHERISRELSQGLESLLLCLKREDHTKEELNSRVQSLCRSRNLLNCYTGQEELEVKVYKVDYNRQNSQYRTWGETMVGNSGAEKFVSCFAVLVAMMNYSRTDGYGTQGRKESSVLILDNPFGAITSAHLLEPMFQIAAAFRVQMICLSDISKCDVTECFDSVIKAAVKKNSFSQLELLEAEATEQVERAFFLSQQRTEQVSLF